MFAVIMTGGSGTRFWPVSREHKPKQFLNIAGNEPMVVETCNRLHPVARDEEVILVLGQAHLDEASDLFEGRRVHMLAEPIGRNTAPCIGLGAIYARHLGCDGAVTDHPQSRIGRQGSPESAAAAIYRGAVRQKDLLILTPVGKIGYWVSRMAPSVYERIMAARLHSELDTQP